MHLNEKIKRRIHLIYDISLSVLLGITAVLFIVSCYQIYKSGSEPFTRASIAEAFSKIAVPVYITIVGVIGGIAVDVAMPKEGTKLKGARSAGAALDKLCDKLNYSELTQDEVFAIEKEHKLRRILGYVNVGLLVLSGILPMIYLLNPANFPAVTGEYNAEILHGMLFYVISLLPLLIYEIAYVILIDASISREVTVVKEAIKNHGTGEGIPASAECNDCFVCKSIEFIKANKKPIILGIRIAFVGTAIVFIIIGIFNGGAGAVLQKAVKICTECIGLG